MGTKSGTAVKGLPPVEGALADALAHLESEALRRWDRPVRRRAGGLAELHGRVFADFSSNDYLGLSTDPRPAEAAARALTHGGAGAGAARLISGTHPLHLELEGALAAFMKQPSALSFASGYAANLGAIPALVGPGDLLYSDALNHASLIDGCRLSGAEVRIFPHGDVPALSEMLMADCGRGGARWIVVEGVYSMDGDLCPLAEIVRVGLDHEARIYLDDAHGVGVLGEDGRGTAELLGIEQEVDVVMGTLGKAFGAAGAFIAGPKPLRDWLLNRARPFVYSTATPPAVAAAAIAAVGVAVREPERRIRLMDRVRQLRQGLAGLGVPIRVQDPGHITGIPVGDPGRTVEVARALEDRGFLVGCIRPPSVPVGAARLRIGLSADHTPAQIDGLLGALGEALSSSSK